MLNTSKHKTTGIALPEHGRLGHNFFHSGSKMGDRRRILALILIMTAVAIAVMGITFFSLYQTSFEQQRARLIETVQSQARLMEAVARFDRQYYEHDIPGGAFAATLSQFRDAHRHFRGFGKTGEFTLAKIEGDRIVFVLSHRHEDNFGTIENRTRVTLGSEYAQPMQRALLGKSGWMVGLDYRGEKVLAAHEPMAELDLGVVAKIDLAEIRRPFIKAGLLAIGGAFILILAGTGLFRRIAEPLIQHLEQSNAWLSIIFDASRDGIVVEYSEEIIYANRALAQLYGHEGPEDLLGKHVSVIQSAEDNQRMLEYGRRRPHGESVPSLYEFKGKRKDGSLIEVEASVAMTEASGKKYIISVIRDISERKQAEQELRKSEERIRLTLEAVGGGGWDWNIATGEVFFSDSWLESLGYERKAVPPHIDFWKSIIHPDDLPEALKTVKEHFEGKAPVYLREHRLRMKNGKYRYSLDRGMVVARDPKGNPLRMVGTDIDITERKQAVDELTKLSVAMKQSPVSVVITDTQGNIEYVNPKFTQITGYDSAEVIGKNPRILQSGQKPPEEYKKLWQALNAGREWQGEFHNKRKNGELFWESASISPILNPAGKVTHFVAVKEDITERKLAEEELIHAKEVAEAANLAKNEFLANMSHEIRTPMNGIMGMTGLLLDTELDEEQLEYAETIEDSADSLLTIINDILDFSKIEKGKLAIEPIPFDLLVTVEETTGMFLEKTNEKQIELLVHYAPDTPHRVVGDPGRIRQILTNLTANAIKFTKKGHVLIQVEKVKQNKGKVTLRLSVADTGIGLAKDKLKSIFGKFNQADTSTTRQYGGTGLGLSISKQLVELMNGSIEVKSQIGKGSTFSFTITLPLDTQAPKEPLPVVNLNGLRILIVDDKKISRRLLHEQISSWGLRTDDAESCEETLSALRIAHTAGDPYRIAILGCRTPSKDVSELGQKIKADPELRDTILMLVTSSGIRGEAKRLKEIGFAAFLTRPIRQSLLMDALATVWEAKTQGISIDLVTRHTVAESRAAQPAGSTPTRQDLQIRVLLAEDNIINQKVAKKMLKKLGCRIDVAANGKEAVDMLEKFPYDLIFMDCQMPEMNGYEATAAIRQHERDEQHIPIIALTANAMKGDRECCLEAGMDDYISKPVRMEELQQVLERWVKIDADSKKLSKIKIVNHLGRKPIVGSEVAEGFDQ